MRIFSPARRSLLGASPLDSSCGVCPGAGILPPTVVHMYVVLGINHSLCSMFVFFTSAPAFETDEGRQPNVPRRCTCKGPRRAQLEPRIRSLWSASSRAPSGRMPPRARPTGHARLISGTSLRRPQSIDFSACWVISSDISNFHEFMQHAEAGAERKSPERHRVDKVATKAGQSRDNFRTISRQFQDNFQVQVGKIG